jgi:hypothetical protein
MKAVEVAVREAAGLAASDMLYDRRRDEVSLDEVERIVI